MEKLLSTPSGIDIFISNSLQEIKNQWFIDSHIPVLLTLDYLSGLEQAKPEGMSMFYGYCSNSKGKLALFHLQVIGFDAEKRLKLQSETGKSSTISDKIALAIKLFVARKVKMKGAILGNLMTAGPYGIVFSDQMNNSSKHHLLIELSKRLLSQSELLSDVQLIVLKDLAPLERLSKENCQGSLNLHEFTIQPSMQLNLRTNWANFEYYLEDLESKYRVKLRKALKAGDSLKIIDADYELIIHYENELYDLYREVAVTVGFNLVELKKEYFASIKQRLPETYKVKLIFNKDKLVAFYTYFIDGTIMNAHFVGYNKSQNRSLDLYHNLLVFYLKEAIQLKLKTIEFARTALEIKSSLGAMPIDYYCYMSHQSKLFNRLVPRILALLIPVEEWQPRSPFKELS